MVPPERVELSSLAPEASTLSTELQGPVPWSRISRLDRGQQGNVFVTGGCAGGNGSCLVPGLAYPRSTQGRLDPPRLAHSVFLVGEHPTHQHSKEELHHEKRADGRREERDEPADL